MRYRGCLFAIGLVALGGACNEEITRVEAEAGSFTLNAALANREYECEIEDASLSYDSELGKLTHETLATGNCVNPYLTNSGTIWVGQNQQQYSDWWGGKYLLTHIDQIEYCTEGLDFEVEATSHISWPGGSDSKTLRLEGTCVEVPEKARGDINNTEEGLVLLHSPIEFWKDM